ncbi:MAG: hypothetical protein M3327_04605 [Actinomycetota bacterium]|nr:hypothetical protein [Actinomycetota bacterium]
MSATKDSDDANQRLLTRQQSLRFVHWIERFRSCMVAKGLTLGELRTTRTELELSLPTSATPAMILRALEACAEDGGGPPREASLQYRHSRIVLYVPKQCLLDKKVASAHA